jgi:hypothetical protein
LGKPTDIKVRKTKECWYVQSTSNASTKFNNNSN